MCVVYGSVPILLTPGYLNSSYNMGDFSCSEKEADIGGVGAPKDVDL